MKTSPAFPLQWRSLLFLAPGGLSHMLDRAGGDDPGHLVWQDPFQILPSFFYPMPLVPGPTLGSCGSPSINAFSQVDCKCPLF